MTGTAMTWLGWIHTYLNRLVSSLSSSFQSTMRIFVNSEWEISIELLDLEINAEHDLNKKLSARKED